MSRYADNTWKPEDCEMRPGAKNQKCHKCRKPILMHKGGWRKTKILVKEFQVSGFRGDDKVCFAHAVCDERHVMEIIRERLKDRVASKEEMVRIVAWEEGMCPDNKCRAFRAGWVAAGCAVVVGDNPYDDETDEKNHWQWLNGWVNRKEVKS